MEPIKVLVGKIWHISHSEWYETRKFFITTVFNLALEYITRKI